MRPVASPEYVPPVEPAEEGWIKKPPSRPRNPVTYKDTVTAMTKEAKNITVTYSYTCSEPLTDEEREFVRREVRADIRNLGDSPEHLIGWFQRHVQQNVDYRRSGRRNVEHSLVEEALILSISDGVPNRPAEEKVSGLEAKFLEVASATMQADQIRKKYAALFEANPDLEYDLKALLDTKVSKIKDPDAR